MRRSARIPCLICLFVAFCTVLLVTFNFERVFSISQHVSFIQPARWSRSRQQEGHGHRTRGIPEPWPIKTSKDRYRSNSSIGVKNQKEVSSTKHNQKHSSTNQTNKISTDIPSEIDIVHKRRVQHIRTVCDSFKVKTHRNSYSVMFSERNKLACKTVPKIGSTFMIQLFSILNGKSKKVLTKSRKALHQLNNPRKPSLKKKVMPKDLDSYTVMTMARNPYSRLFSGYIDKVYLPNRVSLTYDVIKYTSGDSLKARQNKCKFEASFEEFLVYALHPNSNTAILRGHYAPLIADEEYPFVCQLKDFLLVKQESFSQDVQYALGKVRINEETMEQINNLMFKKNAESNIRAITKTLFQKLHKQSSLFRDSNYGCFGWEEFVQRLWKSFQIQGYINMKSEFPLTMFPSRAAYKNVNHVIKVFQNETAARPLSSSEKSKQRQHFLAKAYESISEEIMNKVKKMYAKDFTMFNYDVNLS